MFILNSFLNNSIQTHVDYSKYYLIYHQAMEEKKRFIWYGGWSCMTTDMVILQTDKTFIISIFFILNFARNNTFLI